MLFYFDIFFLLLPQPRNSSPSCESRRKQISLSKAYIYIDNIYK
ncbi:hypothetical protein GLYMA_20G002100v4 [Glycine max]|nr:hypothetical protein GLYMA_20G002100v4 [Glycine max]KAH1033871.1 hypothetical protein GYH30_054334 [Glycine max]